MTRDYLHMPQSANQYGGEARRASSHCPASRGRLYRTPSQETDHASEGKR
jgi:hypothetical protein